MKLSTHKSIIGKLPDKEQVKQLLRKTSHTWQTTDMSWEEAFDWITIGGYATSAELKSGLRASSEFLSRQLFMVDIDSGMTIPELFENCFYNDFGAGFYTTPSHTDEHHRFRIIFVTEEPITNHDDCCYFISSLLYLYDHADTSCRDASRLYPSCTPDCEIKEMTDRIVPTTLVELMIKAGKEREPIFTPPPVVIDPKPMSDDRRQLILDLLCSCSVIEYKDWIRISAGMKAGGYTYDDFYAVSTNTTGKTGPRTKDDIKTIWNSVPKKPVSMGSVIYYIKKRFGPDWWKNKSPQQIAKRDAEIIKLHEKYTTMKKDKK